MLFCRHRPARRRRQLPAAPAGPIGRRPRRERARASGPAGARGCGVSTRPGRAPRGRRRYLLRALIGVAAALIAFAVALPLGVAYIGTHVGRLPASRIDFGPTAETVTLTTSDGI